ncbi:penicillin-binding transpeptidase domain-containing protein [Vallitalea okinawensis]|uniref:penicillin-binding transpeptidase domain-containing protein n=1 Tax=Vallitalea okinawensis TaxID=2078660 RepID=UPI000CFBD6D4|nr:penicillin-binding transpeptidase domain-containing protein [Vallitalea okinawensis]
MQKVMLQNKKRLLFFLCIFTFMIIGLIGRIAYLQIFKGDYLKLLADELHMRERDIQPKRGTIYDRNGVPLAESASVATISVIHNQIDDPEEVARILSEKLDMDYDTVLEKVNRNLALERIKTGVDIEIANAIRAENLSGVMIDEDYKRYYPFSNMASQVLGFVGKDNQGIIGLEVKYDKYLYGIKGKILTETDARGIEIENTADKRIDPIPGNELYISIDVIIQQYAEQLLEKVLDQKEATRGTLIVMNPQNGEIYALANKPDFDLNEPFTINDPELEAIWSGLTNEQQFDYLNKMWRNFAINDTYEPGSTFKIVTASSAIEEGVVALDDTFSCPGFRIVADRRIRCHKAGGHGTQTFIEGVQNSCNPVFMDLGERLGPETFYDYMVGFGFNEKTGIDVPGEAVGIMHDVKNVGPVELATTSFGQSFQITPMQLLRAGAAIVNGGELITPHFGTAIATPEGEVVKVLEYPTEDSPISEATSKTMTNILESVVAEGTGRRTYLPGYKIGGKTATSEKLPRSSNKYISSFLGFAPADNPQVMALLLVDEPVGIYYGGTVAAPVVKELFENILPYLGIEPKYTATELEMDGVGDYVVPSLVNKEVKDIKKMLQDDKVTLEILGEGDIIIEQFPLPGEKINKDSKIIVYVQ